MYRKQERERERINRSAIFARAAERRTRARGYVSLYKRTALRIGVYTGYPLRAAVVTTNGSQTVVKDNSRRRS